MVHPHDQELMDHIERQYWDRGERDFRAYAKAYAAYDGIIWDTAAALLLRLQLATGTPLHLLHTQTTGVVEQIRRAKDRGQDVSAEINPWAVLLGNDWANIERLGSYALSYWVPGGEHRAALGGAPRRHHRPRQRPTMGRTRARRRSPAGPTAGRRTPARRRRSSTCPCCWTRRARGHISLERVVGATATEPARIFGLTTKGRIAVGMDADIAIVDLDREWQITDDVVLSQDRLDPVRGPDASRVPSTARSCAAPWSTRTDGSPAQQGWGQQARPSR